MQGPFHFFSELLWHIAFIGFLVKLFQPENFGHPGQNWNLKKRIEQLTAHGKAVETQKQLS